MASKSAFTPVQHVAGNMCPVAVNMLLVYRQQNCRQFVARLLLDTKGYKSTVSYIKMNSHYVAQIQSTCIPNEHLVAGQHVAVNMYE